MLNKTVFVANRDFNSNDIGIQTYTLEQLRNALINKTNFIANAVEQHYYANIETADSNYNSYVNELISEINNSECVVIEGDNDVICFAKTKSKAISKMNW